GMTGATMSHGNQQATTAGDTPVEKMTNDELIIRLLFTPNHLSRWLTPIHTDSRLANSPRRGEPSVKQLLIELRDHELDVFPRLFAMSTRDQPDLDALPPFRRTREEALWDHEAAVLSIMSQFRRVRQSTGSVLRSQPNDTWGREGLSRERGDTTIRQTANALARHDVDMLARINRALDLSGARQGIAAVSRADLHELLELPV
ncbi:MAG TPA: hypothetical protein VFI22_13395, partial [Thermomicrobiales bacterium]|nr:hypothetical protein [Thermomicrobiales bacterium]